MNQVQITIIVAVVSVIIAIVIYHFYQENKFKQKVYKGFKGNVDDALELDAPVILQNSTVRAKAESESEEYDVVLPNQDTGIDKQLFEEQNDQFYGLDNSPFRFKVSQYDHVIDVAFPNTVKVKLLPELFTLSSCGLHIYIFEKGVWQFYEKGKKYQADGLRVVVNLVSEQSIVSTLQVKNIYNSLEKFTLKHSGVLRQTDSEEKIIELHKNFKRLKESDLQLELFLVHHDYLTYLQIKQILTGYNLVERDGVFYSVINGEVLFYITNEKLDGFNKDSSYRLLCLNAKLHHFKDPLVIVDKVFDFVENYQEKHNARLLTSNRIIMKDSDYKSLIRQINLHIHNMERNNIQLGSELVKLVCP